MREPAAIAHQRDARRATCARSLPREPREEPRDAGARSDRAPARRAKGDVCDAGARSDRAPARRAKGDVCDAGARSDRAPARRARATFSAGDGQLLCLAASAAARERLVDVPADILAGTLPAFIANPFDRPDLRPGELVPELETAGEPGPGLVNGHLPFRVAQRLADRGDLVGGML